MKKEQVYINLQGKTKEELTDLWEFLTSNGEKTYRNNFYSYYKDKTSNYLFHDDEEWISCYDFCFLGDKTEVTISQLKQIIKPMVTFTPIAMKCTQEQFDAVKPKFKGLEIYSVTSFNSFPYLINTDSSKERISNVDSTYIYNKSYDVHKTWNEEIFLKACGIEVETLQEKSIRLENELNEVKKQIEEENKPKVGDVCKFWSDNENSFIIGVLQKINDNCIHKYETIYGCQFPHFKKITNPELIKLLEQEIK